LVRIGFEGHVKIIKEIFLWIFSCFTIFFLIQKLLKIEFEIKIFIFLGFEFFDFFVFDLRFLIFHYQIDFVWLEKLQHVQLKLTLIIFGKITFVSFLRRNSMLKHYTIIWSFFFWKLSLFRIRFDITST